MQNDYIIDIPIAESISTLTEIQIAEPLVNNYQYQPNILNARMIRLNEIIKTYCYGFIMCSILIYVMIYYLIY